MMVQPIWLKGLKTSKVGGRAGTKRGGGEEDVGINNLRLGGGSLLNFGWSFDSTKKSRKIWDWVEISEDKTVLFFWGVACLPKTTLQVVVAFVGMTGSETESSSWVYQLNSCHGLIQDLTYHWCHLNALSLDYWPLDGCGESSFFWFWGVKHIFFFKFHSESFAFPDFRHFVGKVSEKDMSSQGDLTSWKFNVYVSCSG